jgi:hypothetical protein
MTEAEPREVLGEYLTMLQRHPGAEEFMAVVLTQDFETGFEDGFMWRGLDGLRDFLSQFHHWRVRREPDRWRVAAQIVERFADINDNAERLFATPDEGHNR